MERLDTLPVSIHVHLNERAGNRFSIWMWIQVSVVLLLAGWLRTISNDSSLAKILETTISFGIKCSKPRCFTAGRVSRSQPSLWSILLVSVDSTSLSKALRVLMSKRGNCLVWDMVGKIRKEPVYKMIGGRVKKEIPFYCTGPNPPAVKEMGFWGAKVPLPFSPSEGHVGMQKNVDFLKKHRESVGPEWVSFESLNA